MVDRTLDTASTRNDDPLWHQLKSVPAFRALLRAVEARFFRVLDLPQPVLDFGCGDGHFSQAIFNHTIQIGADLDLDALLESTKRGVYNLPLQASGSDLPFPDGHFGSAISNSTLEHIPDIQPVLQEINRVLRPDAPLAITVPSQYFTTYLGGARFFNRLGFENLANSYKDLFNRISRHTHTDSPQVWAERLGRTGFTIERWQYYFSPGAMRAFEIGHAGSLPSAVIHALTGHWILGPWESNLKWTEQWARPHYEEDFPHEGAYIFILARKKSESPVDVLLPPAQPFTKQELAWPEGEPEASDPLVGEMIDGETLFDMSKSPADLEIQSEPEVTPLNWRPIVTGALAILALLFALFGQSNLQDSPDEPGTGLGWFVLSAVMLILLVWQQRSASSPRLSFRLPSLRTVPQRRWLYFLALLLALIVPRFVAADGQQQPGIAVLAWLIAVIIAVFSLTENVPAPEEEEQQNHPYQRFDLIAAVILFVAALLVRLFQLSSHPFILNGSEASIGLDVLNILEGTLRNPFGTAWLTNPTLPLYLVAFPVKLLGPSTFSIRFMSSLLGAITVVTVYLIGRRLYGRTIGLAAAVLLLGSHFHVHYSRLGLTNIWDPLFVLLALGFIAIAWQMNWQRNRRVWLLAGLVTGLNAYLYTSSHLLPIMLVVLVMITFFFERNIWRYQWRNGLAMLALVLVVALPQILYYQAHPNIFMERANIVGILDGQSGWLSREATQTGISQMQLLAGQAWRAAMAFNATLDRGTYYGPFVPLLNFAAGILAALGLMLTLIRYKQLRFIMLAVWIGTTIVFGGIIVENPPNSHRYIIAAPAVMIVAAIALVELSNALLAATKNRDSEMYAASSQMRNEGIYLMVPVLIAIFIAFYDVAYYFGPYRLEHHFADRNTEIANDMAMYLNSLDGDWSAYFYGPPSMYVGFSSIPFLVGNFTEGQNLFDVLEPGASLPLTDSPNLAFIYLPERYAELAETKAAYPNGQERTFEGYYANPLFFAYEVHQN